jgi:hypothetical protein
MSDKILNLNIILLFRTETIGKIDSDFILMIILFERSSIEKTAEGNKEQINLLV